MNDRFESFVSKWRVSAPVGPTLNVGCGWDRLPDAINLDIACIDTADVVGSVDGPLLPIRDDSVACVVAEDVLEHVDHIAAMKELHRVLKPGGLLLLSSVHFSCRDVWVDPTHRRGYSLRTFEFFTGEFADRGYYFDFTFSQLEQGIIDFPANRAWLLTGNPLVRKFANTWPDLYELTGACRAFPAGNVLVALRK